MTRITTIVVIALGLLLAMGPTARANSESSPHRSLVLQIYGGPPPSSIERYVLNDSGFSYEMLKQKTPASMATRTDFVHTALDGKQANDVWTRLAELKIPEWRREYKFNELGYTTFDGVEWSLDYRIGTKSVSIYGHNLFPVAYGSLFRVLNDLREMANQSPDPTLASGTPAAGQPARHP
jgi:hypothetical protein